MMRYGLMYRLVKVLWLAVVGVGIVVAWADEGQTDTSVASDLAQKLESSRNIEGEFRQVTYDERGQQRQVSEGVFLLAHPNRFVWDTISPFPQRVISDGQWLTIWDVDLEQATRKPVSATVGQSPAALLGQPATEVLPYYQVTALGADKFRLQPLQEDGLFSALTLSFSQQVVSAMSIVDALGQTTVIEFRNIETHDGVSPTNFAVELPSYVDLFVEE